MDMDSVGDAASGEYRWRLQLQVDSGDGFGEIALTVAATDGYRWWWWLLGNSIGGGFR